MKRLLLSALGALILSPSASAIVDNNNNGLSDLWEKQYNNGELYPESFDPQADNDGDGWTNAQEAAAGTDPASANPPDGFLSPAIIHNRLVMPDPEHPENGPIEMDLVHVSWPTYVGKIYTLIASDDMSPQSWLQVGDPFIGDGSEMVYHFTRDDSPKFFYRVAVDDIDTDSDGLTDYEESQLGTHPHLADEDGDGVLDGAEIAAGSDPRLPDTDGDGIRDNLDPEPTTGYTFGADADGDGIPDDLDAAPQLSRGLAPTIVVEISLRNEVTDLQTGDVLKIPFVARNSAGSAPGANDFKLIVGGTEDASGTFSSLGNGRFVLTWECQVPANYPEVIMRNLVIRFRDAAGATALKDLGRFDVAEWEGMVAGLAVSYANAHSRTFSIGGHCGGIQLPAEGWCGDYGRGPRWYRGPRNVRFYGRGAYEAPPGVDLGTLSIATGMRYPLFILDETGAPSAPGVMVKEISNPTQYPHGYWGLNQWSGQIKMEGTGATSLIAPGSGDFISLPQPGGEDAPYTFDAKFLQDGEWHTVLHNVWPVSAWTSSRAIYAFTATNSNNPEMPSVLEWNTEAPIEASIVASTAGSLEYPGLPLGDMQEPQTLFMTSSRWHRIVVKVGPDVAVVARGVRLRINAGTSGTNAPQAGFAFKRKTGNGFEDFTLGEILEDSELFNQLTGPAGLVLFAKAEASVDSPHRLSLDLLPNSANLEPMTIRETTLIPIDMVPDWNRDGKIDAADRGKVSPANPWRFWVNDDDDDGETEGTDISKEYDINAPPNYVDHQVNGVRDFVDYFPLHFDLRAALEAFPESEYRYVLTHKANHSYFNGAFPVSTFNFLWYPEAVPDGDPTARGAAGSYLKNVLAARNLATRVNQGLSRAELPLPKAMLQAAQQGKGVALVEARLTTTNPLRLEIRSKAGTVVGAVDLPVSISRVEDMFRHKNLRSAGGGTGGAADRMDEPANLPDSRSLPDWLVFLHGYNVNGEQARGWHSEAFKRLYQSGSNARFVGVSWHGDETQIATKLTPKYYENTENALITAPHLAAFLNGLPAGPKYVAAHSLGCMVAAEAIANQSADVTKAFLYDPAIATGQLLPKEVISNDTHMEPMEWRTYPEEIKSSEWYTRFDTNDARSTLTWRGRLNAAVPKLKVFYSPGEEVLAAFPLYNLPDPGWAANDPQGQYAFAIQAQLKGRLGQGPDEQTGGFLGTLTIPLIQLYDGISPASAHGGWRWTRGGSLPHYAEIYVDPHLGIQYQIPQTAAWFAPPGDYSQNAPARQKYDPVSGTTIPTGCQGLFDPQNGSAVAAEAWKKYRILAQMIPERSLPAGGAGGSGVAGVVESLARKFEIENLPPIKTFDMQENRNGWPESRVNAGSQRWYHSDLREVAYLYTYKAWMQPIIDANLNREP